MTALPTKPQPLPLQPLQNSLEHDFAEKLLLILRLDRVVDSSEQTFKISEISRILHKKFDNINHFQLKVNIDRSLENMWKRLVMAHFKTELSYVKWVKDGSGFLFDDQNLWPWLAKQAPFQDNNIATRVVNVHQWVEWTQIGHQLLCLQLDEQGRIVIDWWGNPSDGRHQPPADQSCEAKKWLWLSW